MNHIFWPTILAQASPLNGGSTTAPLPSPSATPPGLLHLIANHPYSLGDILALVVFMLLAVAVGFVIGVFLRKGGMEGLSKFFGDFTNVLAYVVVILAFLGIFWLASAVLSASTANQENVKYAFGAILPLLGTWVGTVLAHYFQKENLAAATQSITDLASKVAAGGSDKLQSTLVKDVIIKSDQILTLPDKYIGQKVKDVNAQLFLSELVAHLKSINKDRLPLFCDNQTNEDQRTYQKKGVAAGVVHVSTVNAFIQAYTALPTAPGKKDPKDLLLCDLISDNTYKTVFDNSFGLVAEDATLGRAKAVMENLTQKIPSGIKEGCYNVFVTKTGDAKEEVLGWVTNDIINGNAKV